MVSTGSSHGLGSRGAVTPIVGGVFNGRRARGDGGGQDGVALTGTEGTVFIRRADGDRRQRVHGDSGAGFRLTAVAVSDGDRVGVGGRDLDAAGIALVAPSIAVVTAFRGSQRGGRARADAQVIGSDCGRREGSHRDDGVGSADTTVGVSDGDGSGLRAVTSPRSGDGVARARNGGRGQRPNVVAHIGNGGNLDFSREVSGRGADGEVVGQGRLRQVVHGHCDGFGSGGAVRSLLVGQHHVIAGRFNFGGRNDQSSTGGSIDGHIALVPLAGAGAAGGDGVEGNFFALTGGSGRNSAAAGGGGDDHDRKGVHADGDLLRLCGTGRGVAVGDDHMVGARLGDVSQIGGSDVGQFFITLVPLVGQSGLARVSRFNRIGGASADGLAGFADDHGGQCIHGDGAMQHLRTARRLLVAGGSNSVMVCASSGATAADGIVDLIVGDARRQSSDLNGGIGILDGERGDGGAGADCLRGISRSGELNQRIDRHGHALAVGGGADDLVGVHSGGGRHGVGCRSIGRDSDGIVGGLSIPNVGHRAIRTVSDG